MPTEEPFVIEREEDTIILTPTRNLNELEDIETIAAEIYDLLDDKTIKNLVMDFCETDYFGSTTLGFFVHLWKMVEKNHGLMVFCNLSEHEQEILLISKLDACWAICDTREEALRLIGA